MIFQPARLFSSLPCWVLSSAIGMAVANGQAKSEPEELFPDVENATKTELFDWASEHIVNADTNELVALRHSENNMFSLLAAWEQVIRKTESNDDDDENIREIDIAWFVGFLEGKLAVTVPKRWRRLIGASQIQRRSFAYPVELAADGGYQHSNAGNIYFPGNASARISDGILSFEDSKGESKILLSVLGENKVSWAFVDISKNGEDTLAAVHRFGEYYMHCLDAAGNLKWMTKVWAGPILGGSSGQGGFHEVFFHWKDESVFVFGITKFGFYVEEFRRSDGVVTLRFDSLILHGPLK